MPFGEYIPYRGFFKHLANLSSVPLDAIPGHGNGVAAHSGGPARARSCPTRSSTRSAGGSPPAPARSCSSTRPTPLPTSRARCPTQEIAAARLQAISEGRDVVQAAPTGFSAVINHRGRVLARTDLGVRAVIIRDVELRTGRTIYERFGDLPVLVVSGLSRRGGMARCARHRRRSRLPSQPDPGGRALAAPQAPGDGPRPTGALTGRATEP